HAPAETPEWRHRQLVERDERQQEQMLESQRRTVVGVSGSSPLLPPMRPGLGHGQRYARAEDAFGCDAQPNEECAAAGLDVAMSPARPRGVEVTATGELAD